MLCSMIFSSHGYLTAHDKQNNLGLQHTINTKKYNKHKNIEFYRL
jgi:hypothetical protein